MSQGTLTRQAGLFVPVFALRSRSDLGVGDTACLRELIHWCGETGFRVLQVLPINETSADNSPYNAISAHALDITTLALSHGSIPGLTQEIFDTHCPEDLRLRLREGPVAYRSVKKLKWTLCQAAFENFESQGGRGDLGWQKFSRLEASWLEEYALFRALMERNGESPVWERWEPQHRSPALARIWLKSLPDAERETFSKRIRFFSYVQWQLHRQWDELRSHADSRSVRLMGDIPFGISRHSTDVWSRPGQFDLKWSGGAPPEPFFQPDEFTKVWGQNWGVPLYDWEAMASDSYDWWQRRVRHTARFFPVFRIDHILGFYRIYAFPWRPEENGIYAALTPDEAREKAGDLPQFFPSDDATEGGREENRREGEKLLRILKAAAGDSVVVGEDLGMVPVYVRPSLASLGISGFKIPVFERQESDHEYLNPAGYPELSVATFATHDHETMAGFWEGWWRDFETSQQIRAAGKSDPVLQEKGKLSSWELYRTQRFAGLDDKQLIRDYEPMVREALCRRLLGAGSWLAVFMITDLFGMRIRFNVPGPVAESNWSERLPFEVQDISRDPARAEIVEFIRREIKASARG